MATKEELLERAGELEIEGRSSMNKEELEAAVNEAEGTGNTDENAGPAMSAKQIDNSLQDWWAAQIASGATAEDLETALSEFEARGPVGITETAAPSQYGHYAVDVVVNKADDE